MPTGDALASYEEWMEEEGYRPLSIEVSTRHVRTIHSRPDDPITKYQTPHARRYLRFVAETRRHPLGREFTRRLRDAGVEPAQAIRRSGARLKPNLTDQQWVELRARLRRGDVLNKLLVTYMLSGLRIGQFLNATIASVLRVVEDKSAREWLASTFANPRGKKVYQILCPTKRCAYVRLRKRLDEISGKLSLTMDFDTLYKTQRDAA